MTSSFVTWTTQVVGFLLVLLDSEMLLGVPCEVLCIRFIWEIARGSHLAAHVTLVLLCMKS